MTVPHDPQPEWAEDEDGVEECPAEIHGELLTPVGWLTPPARLDFVL
jgi:hypothetical protein